MQIDAKFLAGHVDYSRWATLKILEACTPLGREELNRCLYTSYDSLFGTLVHIYQADAVWLRRLEGHPVASCPEPPPDLEALRSDWEQVLNKLHDFAAALTAERIEAEVPFRSSVRGDSALPTWQVIVHVVNHATYHRGQVTTLLRQLGHHAVSTDMSYYWMDRQS